MPTPRWLHECLRSKRRRGLCRDRRLIGQVHCFRTCTEEFVVLVDLANLPGTESYIRAEFYIVGFDPQPGWGKNLLPIDKHAILESAVRRAEFSSLFHQRSRRSPVLPRASAR